MRKTSPRYGLRDYINATMAFEACRRLHHESLGSVRGAMAAGPAKNWSRRSDLNRGPADYESAALPTELRRLEGEWRAMEKAETRHGRMSF